MSHGKKSVSPPLHKGMKLTMYHISFVISTLQNGLMVLELHPILLSHLSPASLNLLLL